MKVSRRMRKLAMLAALATTLAMTTSMSVAFAGVSTSPTAREVMAEVKDSHDRYANGPSIVGIGTSPSGPRSVLADIVITKRIDKSSPKLFQDA